MAIFSGTLARQDPGAAQRDCDGLRLEQDMELEHVLCSLLLAAATSDACTTFSCPRRCPSSARWLHRPAGLPGTTCIQSTPASDRPFSVGPLVDSDRVPTGPAIACDVGN